MRSCAQRYRDSPEPFDELMQVGYVGLLKAINNFDTEVGESLPAYAQPCVSGEIKRYFRDKRWIVRVKRSVQELRLDIRKASGELTHQLSRAPRDAELASYLNVSEAEVREARRPAWPSRRRRWTRRCLTDPRRAAWAICSGRMTRPWSGPSTWRRSRRTGVSCPAGSRGCS